MEKQALWADSRDLLVAKTIGQPIDSSLPVPFEIDLVADVVYAEPGDDVYTFTSYDDNVDTVYTAADSGEVTSTKKSPATGANLTFVGIQSDLAYVTLNEILDAKDQSALARKKAAITRSMDKYEVKKIFDTILAIASQEVDKDSGGTLLGTIIKMVHKIEDYGDNYVLFCGSTIKNEIDTYDLERAATDNYKVGMREMLDNMGIKVHKVVGTVALDSGSATNVLATTKAILVALDSKLKIGRPVLFVRRKISPEIATEMGFEAPDNAQRVIIRVPAPQVVNNHKNILGAGYAGYESVIESVVNYKAIAWSDNLY